MHVAVLISGVADSRRPLVRPPTGNWLDLAATPTTPFKLSPFDEAALEVALKLRDHDPAVRLTALVTDGAQDVAFMRSIAAFRLDSVAGLPPPAPRRADAPWLSEAIPAAFSGVSVPAVDLWLMGREHGDLDDGVVPAFLAERWGLPFVGLALSVQSTPEGWRCERIFGNQVQTVCVPGPIVASVTNDKGNRLRHPLMKNVMLAKQQKLDLLRPAMPDVLTAPLERLAFDTIESGRRTDAPCRMLEGSAQDQAAALAACLRASATPQAAHDA